MRWARAASGSDRNQTPCAPVKSGAKSGSRASGSSWRHGIRIVRSGTTWPHANVGQNMYGANTSARYSVAAVEQVMEELGDAQVVVDPTLLLGDRQRLAREDARVERRPLDPRRVDDGVEPSHRQRPIDRDPLGELVGPGEVVAGAGRQDLDRPAPVREPSGGLGQNGLGPAYDARPVAGRHEAECDRCAPQG